LTLAIRTTDFRSTVCSKRPVVVPLEFPQPKTVVPHCPLQTESPKTATDISYYKALTRSFTIPA